MSSNSLLNAFLRYDSQQIISRLQRLCEKKDKSVISTTNRVLSRNLGTGKDDCLTLDDFFHATQYDKFKQRHVETNLFDLCIRAAHKKKWDEATASKILNLMFNIMKQISLDNPPWYNYRTRPFECINLLTIDFNTLWAVEVYFNACNSSTVLATEFTKALNRIEDDYSCLMRLCSFNIYRIKVNRDEKIKKLIKATDFVLRANADYLASTKYWRGSTFYSSPTNANERGTTLTIACGNLNFPIIKQLILYMKRDKKLDLGEMMHPHYYSLGGPPERYNEEPYLLILIRVVIIGYYLHDTNLLEPNDIADKAEQGKEIVEYLLKEAEEQVPPYYLDFEWSGSFDKAMKFAKKEFHDLNYGLQYDRNTAWLSGIAAKNLFDYAKFENVLNAYKTRIQSIKLDESHWKDTNEESISPPQEQLQQPQEPPQEQLQQPPQPSLLSSVTNAATAVSNFFTTPSKGGKIKKSKKYLRNRIKKTITRKQKKMKTRGKIR
jgi:hypothetical protein